jgi:hypothetical protein
MRPPSCPCVCVPPAPISARQRGFLFDERKDRSFSAGPLTEHSSGPPPPSRTEAQYCPSRSPISIDVQSASQFWCQAPIWGPRPDLCYCQTSAVFLSVWGALSDKRTGLSFVAVRLNIVRVRVKRPTHGAICCTTGRTTSWR